MVNEHVLMNLVSLKKIQPSLILRLGKIVCVSGISTTCTNWDSQCKCQSVSSTWVSSWAQSM